ncbi:MAG: hypothetical protein Q9191_001495 [Dirinaria sp. TL-2023a]
MRLFFGFFRLLVVSFLPYVCRAIFADESYQIDYHHALLGPPQAHTTFFHRPSVTSKASLLYTLSEKSVVAAINPKDGGIVWRQWLGEAQNTTGHANLEPGTGYLTSAEGTVISASRGTVHAWDAVQGRLRWEWSGRGIVKGLEALEEGNGVVGCWQDEGRSVLRKLDIRGDVVWEHADESGDKPYGVSSSGKQVYGIFLHSALLKGFKIKVIALDGATGKEESHYTLSSESEVTSEDSILFLGAHSSSPLLVWTDKAFKTLKLNILGTKHITSINLPQNPKANVEKLRIHAPKTAGAHAHFLLHYQAASMHWAEVYDVDILSGATTKAYDLAPVPEAGTFSSSVEAGSVYFTRHTSSKVTLLASTSNDILQSWPVSPQTHGSLADTKGIAHVVSEIVSKGPSNFAVRSALTLPSGDWELVQNGNRAWTRPESIAGVVNAAWAEIPAQESLAEELAAEGHSSVLEAYLHRLKRHARDITQYLPSWVEALPDRVMRSISGHLPPSKEPRLYRDTFGFNKIILLATERGRLIALDTGNQGRAIWNIEATKLNQDQHWQVLAIEVEDGIVIVRGAAGDVLHVKILSGEILQQSDPGGVSSSLQTFASVTEVSGSRKLIPINKDGSIGKFSKGSFAVGTVIATKGEDGIVRGWDFGHDTAPSVAWTFVPAAGEEISSIVSRPVQDPVASIGKALGDRNVLYKYLNPNLLLVATTTKEAALASIYLIDSVSGEILYTTSHSEVDTSHPIVATVAENFFAYTLKHDPSTDLDAAKTPSSPKGYQLIITELFESSIPNDRGPLGSSKNFSSIYPTRSVTSPPHVISQAYLLLGPVSALATTSTLQSITPRSLLALLPITNAIISLPRSIVDPRRPVDRDPTPAETEEGLFRHQSIIDFEPKWVLNHKRDVLGLRNVITTPTALESTSAVFAWGALDVFGTRVSPIGGFDSLGRGFSRGQLVLTVLGLAVGTGFVGPMVRKKQIDTLWKS